jgi:hypothetical protein
MGDSGELHREAAVSFILETGSELYRETVAAILGDSGELYSRGGGELS